MGSGPSSESIGSCGQIHACVERKMGNIEGGDLPVAKILQGRPRSWWPSLAVLWRCPRVVPRVVCCLRPGRDKNSCVGLR